MPDTKDSRRTLWLWVALTAMFGLPVEPAGAAMPQFGEPRLELGGSPAPEVSLPVCGFRVVARDEGPQVAITEHPPGLLASLRAGEEVELSVRIGGLEGPIKAEATAILLEGQPAEAGLSLGAPGQWQALRLGETVRLEACARADADTVLRLRLRSSSAEAAIQVRRLRLAQDDGWVEVPLAFGAREPAVCPPPVLPPLRQPIEEALIEWDWRMQDGIHTPRNPSSYEAAVAQILARGDALLADLKASGTALGPEAGQWDQLRAEAKTLGGSPHADQTRWEDLWRRVHRLRRRIALANPLVQVGPLAFVKQVPSVFSHQLTQCYGACARPGGGVFVLEAPGKSMHCRRLAASLPQGSYQHLDVSFDGTRILFAYCPVETTPTDRTEHLDRFYHLYEVAADGSGLRQLTGGPYDDFAPRYLPDGEIIFISTRRGGFHRCGRGPCPVYTLALCHADGSDPRPISYHETHEWDPAVLNDGRVIYTRWDYVDRNAVFYQQLWTVRPDGSDVRIFYGNNTWNPVGVWEARPVPGSHRVMATAAAHHAMSAGSIILVDIARGIDGLTPITRLTPDALFPESEVPVLPHWYAPAGVKQKPDVPVEQLRWPGHCYKSPYPLSEKYFLVSYSYEALIGEPNANVPNMFGLYLADAFGNKELLYRDLNIASLWAAPLRARKRPPVLPSLWEAEGTKGGTFFLGNVYDSWPPVPRGTVRRLRIVQVLPKTTPHASSPPPGLAGTSPGRQVLGTVPVEPDGSAYFRAPAGIPLAFQALDELGQAVQTMRSVTYLQPGETASCVGCHEPRSSAPAARPIALAAQREPSTIQPGPDGSKPFSYPILVQPVLDKKCVSCHNAKRPDGKVILTGEPQGQFTASYHALAPRVPYSVWSSLEGNGEPLTAPDRFGARGSKLMKMLLAGHENVVLSPEEIERLVTWMDTNALFYGTFDPEDQARQQRGERIPGPKLE